MNDDIDIKRLCMDIVRDIYSASRKLAMYPLGHPNTTETLRKSVERLNELFSFKRSFVLQEFNGRLLGEGVLLEDNVFVNGLVLDFKKHGLWNVVLLAELTYQDLYHFLTVLLEPRGPLENHIERYLAAQKVHTVKVNAQRALPLFDFSMAGVQEKSKKLLLSERLSELVQSKIEVLVQYYAGHLQSDDQVAAILGTDVRLSFLKRRVPQLLGNLENRQLMELFRQVVYSTGWVGDTVDEKLTQGIRQLWSDYVKANPEAGLSVYVYELLAAVGAPDNLIETTFDKPTLSRVAAVREMETAVRLLKSGRVCEIDPETMGKALTVLLAVGPKERVTEVLKALLASLTSDRLENRNRALRLSVEMAELVARGEHWHFWGDFVKEMICLAASPQTGPEIVDLVGRVIEIAAANQRWSELKLSVQALKSIAEQGPPAKTEMATEKMASLAVSPILNDLLAGAVLSGKGGSELNEIIAIMPISGLPSILIDKIDAADKAVRTRVMRALVGMGKKAGPVVTESIAAIISQGENNEASNWYRLRNLLRVVGLLRYVEALPYLEVLAEWRQKRVKLEIIAALEATQSALTGPLLAKLAADDDIEVRKAAIVAMGMIGNPDMVIYLRPLLAVEKKLLPAVVAALGRIGGSKARDALIDLYESDSFFAGLTKKEEENLRLTVIRALARIDDDVAKSKLELYSRHWSRENRGHSGSLSGTVKMLLGESRSAD